MQGEPSLRPPFRSLLYLQKGGKQAGYPWLPSAMDTLLAHRSLG